MQNEGHTRKLLIRNISVHDDGEYTCSLGDQESTAEVTVVGKSAFTFISNISKKKFNFSLSTHILISGLI